MRRLSVFVVVLGLTACGPSRESVPDYLARTLPDGASGTVVAARGDEIVHCAGFGRSDHEQGIAATCDTVYDVMSITKQFTAAAVLKLEMMGRLRVTDPIEAHLPGVPADKRGITLHQLLTHTSGLVDALGDDYEEQTREGMIAGVLASPLRQSREFHYSNVGYSLLAAIVEEASGVGYEEFLATHLFGPAGMTSTGYVLPDWDRDQVAVEYDEDGTAQGRPDEHPWADDGPYWNLRGNGGMLSTARDLVRWHRALSRDTFLSADAKRKLFAPHVPIPDAGESYAYGWAVPDDRPGMVWHNGGNDWSLANLARTRDGVMTFWVSNQAFAEWNFEDLEQDLTDGILDRAR